MRLHNTALILRTIIKYEQNVHLIIEIIMDLSLLNNYNRKSFRETLLLPYEDKFNAIIKVNCI